MNSIPDDVLIEELKNRFVRSSKAFSDLIVVNRKLVEMNRRLEESEALKTNFLSNIRNEINNPLNAIIGLATQIASDRQSTPSITNLASYILSEASNLDFQLRNIFIAAELEAGELEPRVSRVDAASVVRNVAETFSHVAGKKNVRITIDVSGGDPNGSLVVATDAEKFHAIASNLLANAIEFSYEGGEVEVLLSGDGETFSLLVRDFGVGVSEENHKKIFDRFSQLDTGSMRQHLGHGLGLSITKSLADLLQGSVIIESRLGEGASFNVTLPCLPLTDDGSTFVEGGNLFLFDDMEMK